MASKPPLVTDMSAFIRGAQETPMARVTIGAKAGDVEAGRTDAQEAAPQAEKAKTKGKVQKKPAEQMPWDEANPKVMKFVQVRMPEPLHQKLAWIKQNSIGVPSVHDLILTALNAMAEQRIDQIKKGNRGG